MIDVYKKHIAMAAVIFFNLIIAGCLSLESSDKLEVSLITDKETYTFGELILLQIIVNTSESVGNVTIEGQGLVSSKGPQLLLGERTVQLLPGTNVINWTHRIPSCSPCTDLHQGDYSINASISHGGDLIAEVSTIVTLTE